MPNRSDDIELKFAGSGIDQLGGAPAEAVIASLAALQRMVHIIGLRAAGKSLGQRIKPSETIRRGLNVVCKTPEPGSHVQPFTIAADNGSISPAALAAREKLLASLKAFDSGDEARIREILPSARERWFMANAAAGLLPEPGSEVEVMIRGGRRGPFAFKSSKARGVIEHFKSAPPGDADTEEVAGKLHTIDYARTIASVKPSKGPVLRFDYPLPAEKFLQENVRRRVILRGIPKFNNMGDVTGFETLLELRELEASLLPVERFSSGSHWIVARKPLSLLTAFEFEDRLFKVELPEFGLHTYADDYRKLRDEVLIELEINWRNYALEDDDTLAPDALAVKRNILMRFERERDASEKA